MESLRKLLGDYNTIYGHYYNNFVYPKNKFKPLILDDVKRYTDVLIYEYGKTKKEAINKTKDNLLFYINIAKKIKED